MRNPVETSARRAGASLAALSASLFLLASCGPPAPAKGVKQADVWYCFAMDRTGKKWAYQAPNIEDASRPALAACRKESTDPKSCQAPEDSNCSNTGAGRVID